MNAPRATNIVASLGAAVFVWWAASVLGEGVWFGAVWAFVYRWLEAEE